jgi:hypothetical protein
MIRARGTAVLAIAALLCACQARDDEAEAPENSEKAVAGKAEEGRISIKAPGFDLAFDVPGGLAKEAKTRRDSKILYPGAAIGGIHIGAGPTQGQGAQSEVDVRFSTPEPLHKVIAWYRDPARADGFRLERAERQGTAYVLTGVQARDRHPFKLKLGSKSGGGTEGELTVRHQD